MVRQLFTLFLLVCVFYTMPVQASNNENLANQIVKKSGLSAIVSSFPSMLQEGVRQGAEQSGGNNQQMVKQINQIIEQAFNIEESIAYVSHDLSSQLSADELHSVLKWLDSPLGKKVTEMELAAIAPESYQQMQNQTLELQKKYRGSERERLFQAFDKSTNATEASLETAIAIQLTLASAMSASSNNPQMPPYEVLKQNIEGNRFILRGVVGQQVYSNYLYTYQSLSDEEIKTYVDFVSSPAGQHYSMVVNESIKNVLLKPSEIIGSKVMKAITSG